MSSSKTPLVKKCRGLHTSPNRYDVPEGALVKATNVLIRRDGVIEPLWGRSNFATTTAASSVDNWHRLIEYGGSLFAAGRRTDGASYAIAMGAMTFAGFSAQATGEDPPDLSSNFTSTTRLPYFDLEFIKTGGNLYYNVFRGLIRIGDTTGNNIRRAGGFPCHIALSPRPINTDLSRSGTTTVTATTDFAHGYVAGITVVMSSAGDANFGAGTYVIVTAPTATTFTYVDATATTTTTLADQTFSAAQFVGSSGIITTNEYVAYRGVLTEYDANGVEYVGEVSTRAELLNASPAVGAAANKNVQLALLFGASSPARNTKLEIYRTKKGTSVPGDEMFKVHEKFLTELDRTRGYVWITDSCPDTTTGKALYTNEAQDGLLRNNSRPACAKTIATWNNKVVMANTNDAPTTEIQLLGTGNTLCPLKIDGSQADDAAFTYYVVPVASGTAFSGTTGGRLFSVYTGGTASVDTKNTVMSLIDTVNWNASASTVSPLALHIAKFTSVAGDWPGRFAIQQVAPDQYDLTATAYVTRTVQMNYSIAATSNNRSAWAPVPGVVWNDSGGTADVARVSNVTTITSTGIGNAGFVVGEYVKVYTGTTGYRTQTQTSVAGTAVEGTITAINSNDITISNTGSDGSSLNFNLQVASGYQPTYSTDRKPNQLRVSKNGNPEAFPEFSKLKVGQDSKAILKCVACNDYLMVFKEDGLFRVIEDADGVLRAETVDPTAVLWAKDTAQPINGKIMAWLTKGVAVIGEQGVEKYVSEPIYDKLLPQTFQTLPFSRRSVAYVDEQNGLYELRLVLATSPSVPYASDTNLTYCIFNDTWVEDDLAVISETFYQGLRKVHIGTAIWTQVANASYAGLASSSFSNFAATSTTNQYTASFSGDTPPVGSRILDDNGFQFYVLSVGAPTCTIFSTASAASLALGASWTVYKPIVCDIKYPPITLVEENRLKLFKEVHVLFGLAEHYVTEVKTSTELVTTQETITAPFTSYGTSTSQSTLNTYDTKNLRLIVPLQHRRAQQLNLEIIVRTAGVSFGLWSILGVGVAADVNSTRVNR